MKKILFIIFVFLFSFNLTFAQHAGKQAIFNASDISYIDYGKAISLNGIKTLSGSKKLTITLWVKWDTKSTAGVGEWANLFTMADSSSNGDNGVFWIQHDQSNTKFEFALQNSSSRQLIQSSINPVEGQWYHLACVFDGNLPTKNMKLYINGVEDASLTTASNKITTFSTKSKLNVGRWPNPANNYRRFNGMIDEISVWSKVLTPAQIINIMNNPESVTGVAYNASNLIGYYNFEEGIADLSPSGNNGTNGGGVVFTNPGNLPIELVDFNVIKSNGKPAVQWTTATEVNNNYFTIERSTDGINGEVIGIVNGAGNSNMLVNYQFVDPNSISGTVYYRIKQTDFDGTTETFNWEAINLDEIQTSVLKVYPNPTTGVVNISLSASAPQTTVNVVDVTGRQIYNQVFTSSDNLFTTLDLSSILPSGVYFIQVLNGNQQLMEKVILK